MIKGIGCDLCAVARMAQAVQKNSGAHFLQHVFAPAELSLFGLELSAINAASIPTKTIERLAANFAAKEAFLKAVGTGLAGFALADVAALRNASGAPYYVFTGTAATYMQQHRLVAHLSLSHEKGTQGMAMAYCILEELPA